jgi:hypothetical protein
MSETCADIIAATTADPLCLYQVERIGQKHQAGSDSLLTAQVFFKIVDVRFNGMSHLDRDKYNCELFGYGSNNTVYRPGHVAATPTKSASSAAMANSAAALGNTAVAYAITSNSNGAANLNAAFVANGELHNAPAVVYTLASTAAFRGNSVLQDCLCLDCAAVLPAYMM